MAKVCTKEVAAPTGDFRAEAGPSLDILQIPLRKIIYADTYIFFGNFKLKTRNDSRLQ